ncbi:MAG: Hint domain-containing protein [Pseudomonadota bacterium]
MAIGEAGVATGVNTPPGTFEIRVELTEPLDNPIIVLNSTNDGGNKISLRVTGEELDSDGNTTAFTFTFDEYEYHDGAHPAAEDVQWLAIEEGTHTLPDGRIIHAGETTLSPGDTSVTFDGDPFPDTFTNDDIVVLTTMSGDNAVGDYGPEGGEVVDSNPYSVTSDGFQVDLLQSEDQAQNGRVLSDDKTVNYIAIEVGNANGTPDADAASAQIEDGLDQDSGGDQNTYVLDDFFSNPVVLAETQSQITDDPNGTNDENGDTNPDAGTVLVDGVTQDNGSGQTVVDLEFEEEESEDNGNTTDETVGIVAFEEGVILCFTRDTLIETVTGPRPVQDLAIGDMIRTKDHGLQPLRWIGRKTCDLRNQNGAQTDHRPYRLPRSTFGPDLPDRDLFLSPQHRIAIDAPHAELLFDQSELLVPVKHLRSSGKVTGLPSVEYFHLMFDQHQVVYANGLPCESLYPGDLARDALSVECAEELFAIFPNLRSMPESYGPTSRKVLRAYETRVLSDALGI